jgi:hypothetical protein
MAARAFLSLFLAALFLATSEASLFPCPFNNDCNCTGSSPWDDTFTDAVCSKPGYNLQFNGAENKFTINGPFDLTSNVYNLKARSFNAFKVIEKLTLIQSELSMALPAQWEAMAFKGPQIKSFTVSNLTGVIPPPLPLQEIAGTLEELQFFSCGQDVYLGANYFARFNNLKKLAIVDTPLHQHVDTAAFGGLEDTLVELNLNNLSLNAVPTAAISTLTKLVTLDLSWNNIQSFTPNDFSPFKELVSLGVNGNNLTAAYESGALDNIPEGLTTLILEYGGLQSVPVNTIRKRTNITLLSLANNNIRTLHNGDFPNGNQLNTLVLANSPVVTIEPGALQYLTKVQILALYRSGLVDLDLTLFKGMNNFQLLLDGSSLLRRIWVSDPDQAPANMEIHAKDTILQTIDRNISSLLDNPKFILDISDNAAIDCKQDIAWMAKYALCASKNLVVVNTRCTPASGGQLLNDTLAQEVPNACTDLSSTSSSSTSSTASGSTPSPGSSTSSSAGPTGTGPTSSGTSTAGTGPTSSGTTTVGPTTTTAKKGASIIAANLFLTSAMVAILASIIKSI